MSGRNQSETLPEQSKGIKGDVKTDVTRNTSVEVSLDNTPKTEYPDGGWGWIVLFGGFLCFFTAHGSTYGGTGLLYIGIQEARGYEISKLACIGSITTGLMCAMSTVVGPFTNYFACRTLVICGGLLCASCCVCLYFYISLPFLYVFLGILPGFGLCMVITPTCLIISQYFDKKRGVAFGLAICGSAFGVVAFPPLLSYVMQRLSLNEVFLVYAGIWGSSALFGCIYVPRKANKYHGKHASIGDTLRGIIDKELLMTPKFIAFCVANFLISSAFAVSLVFIPIKGKEEGLTLDSAALLMTVFGVATCITRVSLSLLIQVFHQYRVPMYFYSACIYCAFFVAIVHCRTFFTIALSAAGFGVFAASYCLMYPVLLVDMFGQVKLPNSLGLTLFSQGAGSLFGPSVAGLINDIYDKSDASFYFAFGCSALAVCCFAVTFYFTKNKTHIVIEEIQVHKTEQTVFSISNDAYDIFPSAA